MNNNIPVIGIAGPSGGGKTTFVKIVIFLLEILLNKKILLISLDDYYLDRSSTPPYLRWLINFDKLEALNTKKATEDIKNLKRGKKIKKAIYCFKTHTIIDYVDINPDDYDVIFVEGHLLFGDEQLMELFDTTTFVDVPQVICFLRRLIRDMRERGRNPISITFQYLTMVYPSWLKYIKPSKDKAKIKAVGGGYDPVAILELIAWIKKNTP